MRSQHPPHTRDDLLACSFVVLRQHSYGNPGGLQAMIRSLGFDFRAIPRALTPVDGALAIRGDSEVGTTKFSVTL